MRYWKKTLAEIPSELWDNSQPTYEVLKKRKGGEMKNKKLIFPAYLWGIENEEEAEKVFKDW